MTEKEKAEAYDEALKKANAVHKDEDRHLKATLERIFPELKESKDEKIRKEIISILRNAYWTSNKNRFNELVAWLEKQDEQASIQTNERAWLYLVSDVLTWKDGIGQYLDDPRVQELAKKLCSEYAQKLYNPWELVHDKKSKFDPKTLHPYDKVLVRRGNENYNVWFPDFVSDPPNNDNNKTLCMCIGDDIAMVIPYNNDTKHLIGTTDEAPEFYKYWED